MFTSPKATPALLSNYNFKEESKYYKEYKGNQIPTKKIDFQNQIPNFYEPQNDDEYQEIAQEKKKNSKASLKSIFEEVEHLKFKKELNNFILKDDDILLFKSVVECDQYATVLFDSINWNILRHNSSFKNSLFLTDDFLSYFKEEKIKENQKKIIVFKSVKYIDCLLLVSRLFKAFKFFEKIDPKIFYNFDSIVSEDTISSFIEEMIKHINSLKDIGNHLEYYVTYATSLIMSFLTSYESEKIPLKKLLFSNIFIKFINLDYDIPKQNKHLSTNSNLISDEGFPNLSSSLNSSKIKSNPFRLCESTQIYNMFIKLDSSKAGYLKSSDIKEISGFEFTDAFLDRLFHNVLTDTSLNNDRMDYILFLRFYISLNYMNAPLSVDLFFNVADVDGDGIISLFDILFFYKEMLRESQIDKEKHSYDRFVSELFDITKSSPKDGITKKQIYKCKVGNPFFLLLFDVKTFIEWEEPSE